MSRSLRISFRAFTLADLALFDLLPDEREAVLANAAQLGKWADKSVKTDYERRACATTLFDGQPLFICGYYEIEPGTIQVFIIPDKRAKRYQKSFVRAVKVWLRWLEGRPWCERLQTASLPTRLVSRWMASVGFSCGVSLTGYTGQEYKLWSRVKLNGIWRPL